jgi:AcrR family transcriptional regulator
LASSRRFGPRDSETSLAILDATEQVMRAEGYGAITSRRVAEEAGIRQGLVYYYYETMDEVLLACFQRRTAQALARYESEVRSERPVHAIWEDLTNTIDARLVFEFVALANHHDGIRAEGDDPQGGRGPLRRSCACHPLGHCLPDVRRLSGPGERELDRGNRGAYRYPGAVRLDAETVRVGSVSICRSLRAQPLTSRHPEFVSGSMVQPARPVR